MLLVATSYTSLVVAGKVSLAILVAEN